MYGDLTGNPLFLPPSCLKQKCSPRNFYGRPQLVNLHPFAYQTVYVPPKFGRNAFSPVVGSFSTKPASWWITNDDVPGVFASSSSHERDPVLLDNDEIATYYLRKYNDLRKKSGAVQWFHVIVRYTLLKAFFDRLMLHNKRETRIFLLEFSCWCDGTHVEEFEREEEPSRSDDLSHVIDFQHRHFILVSENSFDFYRQFWTRVASFSKPVHPWSNKMLFEISSWEVLRDVIHSVSVPSSRCAFGNSTDRRDHRTNVARKNVFNNYCIFAPLCPDFKLCVLLATFEGERAIKELTHNLFCSKKINLHLEHFTPVYVPEFQEFRYGILLSKVIERRGLVSLVGYCPRFFYFFKTKLLEIFGVRDEVERRSIPVSSRPPAPAAAFDSKEEEQAAEERKKKEGEEHAGLCETIKRIDDPEILVDFFFKRFEKTTYVPKEVNQSVIRTLITESRKNPDDEGGRKNPREEKKPDSTAKKDYENAFVEDGVRAEELKRIQKLLDDFKRSLFDHVEDKLKTLAIECIRRDRE